MSKQGIIAAGHKETAQAGRLILDAGGNAFDAALAALFTAFVAEPTLTSMGGGGFFLSYTAEGKANLFDFFVQTPQRRKDIAEQDLVRSQINFGHATQAQYIGRGTTAVPGCPAGIETVHRQLCSMPLSEIVQPAIDLCKRGVEISSYQEYSISILEPVLLHSHEMCKIFGKEGQLTQQGDIVYRPQLAESLERFCRLGAREFYEGDIAQILVKDHKENGGCISTDDLKAYTVVNRMPLSRSYRKKTVLTNPLPSAGGSMIVFGLAFLEQVKQMPKSHGPDYVKLLIETMQKMDSFRINFINNPSGNTTHISVMDKNGNAASLTSTMGGACGYTIPETGIPLNNMLGETDLNPDGVNSWVPGTRLTSMMAPTIVLDKRKAWLALGSGGSSRIRSAILQVLIQMIDYNRKISKAVLHPRCHWENASLSIEPGLLDEMDDIGIPESAIKRWDKISMFFGGVHAIAANGTHGWSASADSRRDGYAY